MKKLLLLLFLIPNLVIADLKPLSSIKEHTDATFLYEVQRCSALYDVLGTLFDSHKDENGQTIEEIMQKKLSHSDDRKTTEKAKWLFDVSVKIIKNKSEHGLEIGQVTLESNNNLILAIRKEYLEDMASSKILAGEYINSKNEEFKSGFANSLAGKDMSHCKAVYIGLSE